MPNLFWLLACSLADLPSRPPPAIDALLRLPPGAVVDQDECLGTPGTEGFLCGRMADAPVGMAEGADLAAVWFSTWDEIAWDRVPGRIQYSWQDGPAYVSLAVHDRGPGRSRWSWHYTWTARASPAQPEPPLGPPAPTPPAWPPLLAPVPRPDDAVVLAADARDPDRPSAAYRTASSPDDVVARVLGWPGASEELNSRGGQRRSAQVRLDGRDYAVTCRPDDAATRCDLRTWPAP